MDFVVVLVLESLKQNLHNLEDLFHFIGQGLVPQLALEDFGLGFEPNDEGLVIKFQLDLAPKVLMRKLLNCCSHNFM